MSYTSHSPGSQLSDEGGGETILGPTNVECLSLFHCEDQYSLKSQSYYVKFIVYLYSDCRKPLFHGKRLRISYAVTFGSTHTIRRPKGTSVPKNAYGQSNRTTFSIDFDQQDR